MIQPEGLPDLTKSLPWWLNYALWAAVGLAVAGSRLRKRLQTADAAEEEKYKARLAKELEPYLKRLDHAERLAALLEKENGQLAADLKDAERDIAEKDARIARYLDDEVEMQKKLNRVIGQCETLEKRCEELESRLNAK